MGRNDDWIKLLALLLFAGAITYTPRAPATAAAAATPSRPAASPGGESGPPASDAAALVQRLTAGAAPDVSFLIATIPDPVDSEARWMFDPLIDAISSAAAAEGFSLYSYYLPDWDPAHGDEAPGAAGKRHEIEPGVIAFRQTGAAPGGRLLVVFLVYETPTAGIHPRAFDAAVQVVRARQPCTPAKPIRILGPTFSGSAISLRDAMVATAGCAPAAFTVVTGSATSLTTQTLFRTAGIRFDAAVLSDTDVVPALMRFVCGRYRADPTSRVQATLDAFERSRGHILPPRIAVLVESSPYGNDLTTLFGPSLSADEGDDPPPATPGCTDAEHVELLRFPLHISRLRSADAASPPPGAVASRPQTPIVLGTPAGLTDRLPVMTSATTAPAVEEMLASILERIRRTRVNAVGLFATDTRDKLFLARQIADAIPGILLFTTETDILYAHPQFRDAVRGMIVASTYPAVASDALLIGNIRSRFSFSNSMAFGAFNAALTLLHRGTAGGSPPDLLQYAASAGATGPPLWISQVAGDSIWPVAYVPLPRQSYSTIADARAAVPADVNASAWTWFTTLALLLVVLLQLVAHPLLFWRWGQDSDHPVARAARAVRRHIGWSAPRRSYVLQLWVSHFALVVIAALFTALWWCAPADKDGTLARVVSALTLGVAMAALLLVGVPSAQRPRAWGVVVRFMAVVFGAAMLAFLGFYFSDLAQGPAALHLLFFDRAAHPRSGTSPIFAMACVVAPIYLWGVMRLVWVNATPSRPLLWTVRANAAGGGGEPSAARLYTLFTAPREATSAIVAVPLIIATLVSFGVLWVERLVSVEPYWYTMAFLSAWMVVQILIGVSFAQAAQLWSALRRLLRLLAAHPLAASYGRLAPETLGDRLSPRRPRLADLAALVDARERLGGAAALRAQFNDDLAENRRAWGKTRTFRILTCEARTVRRLLAAHWWGRGDRAPADSPRAAWYRDAEEFLATFVVLFVREALSRLIATFFYIITAVMLLIVAQTSFPFHPRQVLLALTWVYGLATALAAVVVFVSIEHDTVLARIASTPEGKIVWDRVFVGKVAVYALIPLLTLFAAQFPQIGSALQQWLTPMRQAMP